MIEQILTEQNRTEELKQLVVATVDLYIAKYGVDNGLEMGRLTSLGNNLEIANVVGINGTSRRDVDLLIAREYEQREERKQARKRQEKENLLKKTRENRELIEAIIDKFGPEMTLGEFAQLLE